mgnify:CR=1 FL=1
MGRDERIDRFKRVATNRTNKVIASLQSLSKCSDKKNYEYDVQQVRKIFNTIDTELRYIKSLFRETRRGKFRL